MNDYKEDLKKLEFNDNQIRSIYIYFNYFKPIRNFNGKVICNPIKKRELLLHFIKTNEIGYLNKIVEAGKLSLTYANSKLEYYLNPKNVLACHFGNGLSICKKEKSVYKPIAFINPKRDIRFENKPTKKEKEIIRFIAKYDNRSISHTQIEQKVFNKPPKID